jgi:AraC-like DNA-binding protein
MREIFQTAKPSALFEPFIRYYKYIESDLKGIYKCVPIPYVELYFNFTHVNFYSPNYYNLNKPQIHLAGLQKYDQNSYSHMFGTDRGGGFCIVFQPQGFYHLFGIKSSDFCKYAINGESVLKKDIDQLLEKLQSAYNVYDIKELVERYLSKYAIQACCKSDLINAIISYMDRINGMVRVSQISNIFNITPRSLERHFMNDIGISPTELLHIFRINKAIRLINEKPEYDLTGISYLSGYYDQAHFIKDIKKITGISPGQFQRKNTIEVATQDNRLFIKTN